MYTHTHTHTYVYIYTDNVGEKFIAIFNNYCRLCSFF